MLTVYFWLTYLGTVAVIGWLIYGCWRDQNAWSIARWKWFPTLCILLMSLCPVLNIFAMAILACGWVEEDLKSNLTVQIRISDEDEYWDEDDDDL